MNSLPRKPPLVNTDAGCSESVGPTSPTDCYQSQSDIRLTGELSEMLGLTDTDIYNINKIKGFMAKKKADQNKADGKSSEDDSSASKTDEKEDNLEDLTLLQDSDMGDSSHIEINKDPFGGLSEDLVNISPSPGALEEYECVFA